MFVACATSALATTARADALFDRAEKLSESDRKEDLREAESLLTRFLSRHPRDTEATLLRAQVRSWLDEISEAAVDYRVVLAKQPNAELELEFATALSWSSDPTDLDEAARRLAHYLAAHDTDAQARLLRAQVLTQLDRLDDALADYNALARGDGNPSFELELATALAESDTARHHHSALALFDHYLADWPDDGKTRLQRARVRIELGQIDAALADYRALKPADRDAAFELELATAFAEADDTGHHKRALALFDGYLAKQPNDAKAKLGRARALLATDDLAGAERALDGLVDTAQDQVRDAARLELARVYEQSERNLLALGLVDRVVADEPALSDAASERRAIAGTLAPSATPSGEAFANSDGTSTLASTVEANGLVGDRAQLIVRGGTFYASAHNMDAFAHRGDAGVRFALGSAVGQVSAGVRDVANQVDWAGRAALAARPRTWLKLDVEAGRDYVYDWAYRLASMTDRVRGEYARLHVDLDLPHAIAVEAELVGRVLVPENRGVAAQASVIVPIVGPLRLGYRGEAQSWEYDTADYWSPLGYASSVAVLGFERDLKGGNLATSVELGAGAAWEQVTIGTFFGPTFDGDAELKYRVNGHFDIHANATYLHTLPRAMQMATPTAYWEARAMLAARIVL